MKQIIKALVPSKAISKLRNIKTLVDERIIVFFSKNGFLASFYYLAFSRQFDREHKSVIQGRIAYKSSLGEIGSSSTLLRRNIHRLEKGLIMRPRRSVFAQDYIQETVDNFAKCADSKEICSEEFRWGKDVLSEYFSVVEQTSVVANAKQTFEMALHKNVDQLAQGDDYIPYSYDNVPETSISYEQLFTLFKRRRSVRWYQEKSVDYQMVAKAIDAATLAPSACNRQPYRFHVETDPKKATVIAKCAMGTAGFAENLQAMVVVIGDLSAYPKERDRHVIYIDASLASMQLMLSLETLGLSSCPINWPDIEKNERKLERLLQLKSYERPIMLMATGFAHPEGGVPFSQKKSSEILIRN